MKRVWHSQPGCVQLEGVVNGHRTMVLLDSGAAISVVPESLVDPSQKAGRTVAVKPFGAQKPLLLPTASVTFKIGDLEWVEGVAVAPKQEGAEEEVLYSLDLKSKRGLELVLLVNNVEQKDVLRMMTRAQSKSDKQGQEEEVAEIARDKPKAKPLVPSGQDVCDEPREGVEPEVVEQDILCRKDEEAEETLGIVKDASVVQEEDVYQIREESGEEPDLVVPLVKEGKGDREALVAESKRDPSLEKWRKLADKDEGGFIWEKGLLYQEVTTHTLEQVLVLVLPKPFREKVLVLAHDRMQHMGARRVTILIKQRFTWPGMGQDIIQFCRSCSICQKCSKPKARKALMVERPVLSEPFEVLGVDIVGPMPKGKGGYRYLLTAICMATRWPEAIPLKSITAKAVAVGLFDIFSRTGIPLQILSDQGSGAVMRNLCASLHVDKIKTTPYHPEGNGVVERMHGTLGAMLTKAAREGQDWVGQVPFALFALRAAPNRDIQFSPFELVFGRKVRTPLDIIHQGWAEIEFEQLEVQEWAQWLTDKLEVWHDVMRSRAEDASRKRKVGFDKKAVNRELEKGDLVLCSMVAKLEESWYGPYLVVDKLNRVDYKVEVGKGRTKVLHINNLKKFYAREEEVLRLAVVAEDCEEDEAIGVKVRGRCEDFDERQLERTLGMCLWISLAGLVCVSYLSKLGKLHLFPLGHTGCLTGSRRG